MGVKIKNTVRKNEQETNVKMPSGDIFSRKTLSVLKKIVRSY